ncbi:MAG: hypothetical protein EOM44_14070 [Bacteroidia bacterium]|nr:hypothetical protein [Bacteroidia bacterium]
MKRKIDIAKLKVLLLSGGISAEKVKLLIDRAEADKSINLLKSSIVWYLEEVSGEEDVFLLVKKICNYFDIHFISLSSERFFAICKAIQEQNEVISQIIQDIQYPELTDIQKEAGYGEKHFGTAGLICNLAEAFNIDYLQAEKQPVIALTKLRMQAHLATCRANEQKIKDMFKKD